MPSVDWNALVPIGVDQLVTSVASFMGLSIVGALLFFKISLPLARTLIRTIERVITDVPRASDLTSDVASPGYIEGDDIEGTGTVEGGTAYIYPADGGFFIDDWQGNRGNFAGRFVQDGNELVGGYRAASAEDYAELPDEEIERLYGNLDFEDMVDEHDGRWNIAGEYARRGLAT